MCRNCALVTIHAASPCVVTQLFGVQEPAPMSHERVSLHRFIRTGSLPVSGGLLPPPRPAPAGVKVVLVTFNKPQRSCGRRDSSGWSPNASVKEVILKSDEYYLMQVTSSRKPSQINPPSPRNMYFIRLHGNSLLFRRRGVCRICLRNSVPVS